MRRFVARWRGRTVCLGDNLWGKRTDIRRSVTQSRGCLVRAAVDFRLFPGDFFRRTFIRLDGNSPQLADQSVGGLGIEMSLVKPRARITLMCEQFPALRHVSTTWLNSLRVMESAWSRLRWAGQRDSHASPLTLCGSNPHSWSRLTIFATPSRTMTLPLPVIRGGTKRVIATIIGRIGRNT
jgi:hypothetical protein